MTRLLGFLVTKVANFLSDVGHCVRAKRETKREKKKREREREREEEEDTIHVATGTEFFGSVELQRRPGISTSCSPRAAASLFGSHILS